MEDKNTLIRKNIDLPLWVVEIFTEKASKQKNKFKPYIEWYITKKAAELLKFHQK